MSDKEDKIRSGFRVVGPNLANFKESTWYFPTLDEAKKFARGIAAECDAEYDILQYVGTIRQVPLPPRLIEWLESEKTQK